MSVILSRIDSFSTGLSGPTATAIDSAGAFLYIVSGASSPVFGLVVDNAGGFVYATPSTTVVGYTLIKMRLSDGVVVDTVTITGGYGAGLYRHSISSLGSYTWFDTVPCLAGANSPHRSGTYVYTGVESTQSAFRANLSNANTFLTNAGSAFFRAGALDAVNNLIYYVGYVASPETIRKVDISGTNFNQTASVAITGTGSGMNSATIDNSNQFLYVGNRTVLSKINLSSFTETTSTAFAETSPTSITGSDFNAPTQICLSSSDSVFCVRDSFTTPTWNPSWVTVFNKSTMIEGTALLLNSGESRIISGAIDTVNQFLYLTSYGSGTVIKVSYAAATTSETLSLDSLILSTQNKISSVDSLLLAKNVLSLSVDSLLLQKNLKSLALDALLFGNVPVFTIPTSMRRISRTRRGL